MLHILSSARSPSPEDWLEVMRHRTAERLTLEHRVLQDETGQAADLLAQLSGLSKSRIKDAMEKGAVWLSRSGARGGRRRLRRATAALRPGDLLSLYFDTHILSMSPPQAQLMEDRGHYSIWFKPPGLLAQGTRYADHCALTRQAEIRLAPGRQVLLVHRLDREARGLMILAHSGEAAARLSRLFRDRQIEKCYRVEVLGRMGPEGVIDLPLDGKPAKTQYRVLRYDDERDRSILDVTLETGRLHQIRRHLDALGHPVVGDPRYGRGNKDSRGLQLIAYALRFRCPYAGRIVSFQLSEADMGL